MNKKEQAEIIEKCRKLVPYAEKVLMAAMANFRTYDEVGSPSVTYIKTKEWGDMMDIVESIRLVADIKALLGFKEDEQEEGKLKQFKMDFYGEESKT